MKKRLIFAAMLLLAFGSVKAQDKPIPTPNGDGSKINTLVVSGTGSVWLKQGDKLTINDYGHHYPKCRVEDSVLYLEGTGARELTLQNLAYLKVLGTAGVRSKGQLKGENLSINKTGTGVLSLEVGYNNIYVRSCGTGDVILLGDCNVFCSEVKSLGKVNASNLNYMVLVEKSGDKWNMAINIDDELTDSKRNFLNGLVNNAAPFFEAESNRSWDPSFNVKAGYEPLDTLQFKELMRELGVNLQQLSDSVDWEKFEQDMEQWGADMEEWGRKMEQWGAEFEKKYDMPNNYRPAKKDDSPVRVIRVTGSGDVVVSQTPGHFSLKKEGKVVSDYRLESELLLLSSSDDYEVEVSQLENIQLLSSADVVSKGTIKGDYINIYNSGSGDMVMELDYDTVHVVLNGSGDIILQGRCNVLQATVLGSGDLRVDGLNVAESNFGETSSSKVDKPKDKRPVKKNLLYDANWNGFEAGLNMLMGSNSTGNNDLELRPMRSWVFNFNIADVGIAFDRRHTAGLYTGIGLGWNNYSFNNPVRLTKGENHLEVECIDPAVSVVKRSKLGVLYVQAPLMIEVRPTRRFYIAAGVTGGLRVDTWTKIVFRSGDVNKVHSDYYVNPYKLDATLRIGGNNLGFFAQYNLLPTFDEAHAPTCHTANFGFSINF